MRTLVSMLAAGLLLLPGCGTQTPGAEKPTVIRAAVSTPADVQRVTLSAFGDSRSYTFDLSPGSVPSQWSGGGEVRPGSYWLQADAYDVNGALLYTGSAGPFSVELNQTTFVGTILAQSAAPPPPFVNTSPRINHVYVSSLEIPLEGTARVLVAASDRDPGSVLTYAWSATDGWFEDPAAARTVYHAAAVDEFVTVTILVTDEKGATAQASFQLVIGSPSGEIRADVAFNSWPEVTSMSVAPTRVSSGEPTVLSVTATDPDGDPLMYSWGTSNCGGWFSDPAAPTTTFWAYYSYAPDGACDVYVYVLDGRGGSSFGGTTIWIAPPPPVSVLPTQVQNGSFETGDYAGWQLEQRQGSVIQPSVTQGIAWSGQTLNFGDGALDYFSYWWKPQYSPGLPVTFVASDGNYMAFTLHDASYFYASNARLYQDVALPAVPEGGRLVLAWDMRYWNHHTDFVPPGTPPGPQRFAVQLLDIVTGARLATVFATNPGDPLSIPMTAFEVDLSAWAGQEVRLNFVLTQTYSYFDLGLDNVRLYTVAPPQEPLLVRTASGATMDVTGTSWAVCLPGEPGSGAWRLTTMSFGVGTFTATESFYATDTCTGEPVSTEPSMTAAAVSQGDHVAGWDETPPPGLDVTVTATAVLLSGAPGSPLEELKTLLFVNDTASPAELHFGGKTPGADGYPTTLERTGRRLVP